MTKKEVLTDEKVAKSKSGKLDAKSIQIIRFLLERPEGVRVEYLQKVSNLPLRTLYRKLNHLKTLGLVHNIFPLWKIAKNQADSLKVAKLLQNNKKIQSHKFSFILPLVNTPDWWQKRENRLIKLKEFHFKPISWGNSTYQQLAREDFLIQVFANSIVFINRKHYWTNDSYEAFIEALQDTLAILSLIEELFKCKFCKDGVPQLTVRTHHYVKLRDSMAEHCKKTGEKFELEVNGKLRAWIDMSEPLGMEFGNRNYAPEDTRKYTNVVTDYIEHNAARPVEVDKRIENVLHAIEGIQQNQLIFDHNMVTHLEVLTKLGKAVEALTGAVEEIKAQAEKSSE
ncbi:hypothetical protein M0R04_09685 [Candidatus Dojkabacteria bacterium]|jgi:hypothetical protein|nr:hypothetical protein [Candidatus Dojkabacteria bacterium]